VESSTLILVAIPLTYILKTRKPVTQAFVANYNTRILSGKRFSNAIFGGEMFAIYLLICNRSWIKNRSNAST